MGQRAGTGADSDSARIVSVAEFFSGPSVVPTAQRGKDQRVKKGNRILLGFFLLCCSTSEAKPQSDGISCDETQHTRLEITICAEPYLQALDNTFLASINRAIDAGVMAPAQGIELRNSVARNCRHESDVDVGACLLVNELGALEKISTRLGEIKSEVRLQESEAEIRQRYSGNIAEHLLLMHRQLLLAEDISFKTGKTDLMIATLVNLLETYQSQLKSEVTDSSLSQSIAAINLKLSRGCNHELYARQWRRSLQTFDISCARIQEDHLAYDNQLAGSVFE